MDNNCSVYVLKFPDNKCYVGLTTIPIDERETGERFENHKSGLYEAILKFGWHNITKETIYKDLSKSEAVKRKQELILQYESYYADGGFNRPCEAGLDRRDIDKRGKRRNYTVYVHVVPNGKVYVGQTIQQPEFRWKFDGLGYKDNPPFFADIQKYGWNNIAHVIICDTLTTYKQADYLERYLIQRYQSTNPEYGYNRHNGILHEGNSRKSELVNKMIMNFLRKDSSLQGWLYSWTGQYHGNTIDRFIKYLDDNWTEILITLNGVNFHSNRGRAAYLMEMLKNCGINYVAQPVP